VARQAAAGAISVASAAPGGETLYTQGASLEWQQHESRGAPRRRSRELFHQVTGPGAAGRRVHPYHASEPKRWSHWSLTIHAFESRLRWKRSPGRQKNAVRSPTHSAHRAPSTPHRCEPSESVPEGLDLDDHTIVEANALHEPVGAEIVDPGLDRSFAAGSTDGCGKDWQAISS